MDMHVAAAAAGVDVKEEEMQAFNANMVKQVAMPSATVSDLDVAAQYADMEIQTVAEQFASASVASAAAVQAPVVVKTEVDMDSKDDDAESSSDEDDDEEDVEDQKEAGEDTLKLRKEIEEAMEREENKAAGPLKTANELAVVPVREAPAELTADCPIAKCGTVLNVSTPGLMITVQSEAGVQPLDEGSVLCCEDRTVIGCVDEVFGPVLLPMYLVRYESAEKMPANAAVGSRVFYATQHVTYIIPDQIKDKGTDASNIFDEEAEEEMFSDDEAEAAAKRQNRKRNRGGQATGNDQAASSNGLATQNNSVFSDYQTQQRHGGGAANGRGRGGRGGRFGNDRRHQGRSSGSGHHNAHHNSYVPSQQAYAQQQQQHMYAPQHPMAMQGYQMPGQPPLPPFPPQQHYGGHPGQALPPYPPQAPPPMYYHQQQYQPQQYQQHQHQQAYGPPGGAYYGAPPAGHFQPPPPPPPSSGHPHQQYQ